MVTANDTQIGGEHYASGAAFQHWDMVTETFGPGYLVGCATKYIYRCFKKNGKQDLEKSLHYIDKLEEAFPDYPSIRAANGFPIGNHLPERKLAAFTKFIARDNEITPDQTLAMQCVIEGNFERARRIINEGLIPAVS